MVQYVSMLQLNYVVLRHRRFPSKEIAVDVTLSKVDVSEQSEISECYWRQELVIHCRLAGCP